MSKRLMVVVLAAGVLCLSPMGATARVPQQVGGEVPAELPPKMVIPAGPHYLATWDGTTDVALTFAADFFFEGSAAVDEMVPAVGDPAKEAPVIESSFEWRFARLVESGEADAGEAAAGRGYDTVMVQMQRAVLPRIGAQDSVDLMLSQGHVRSVAPVEISGSETRYYDLRVEITSDRQDTGGGERMGYMAFTRDGIASGYFAAEIYGWARYIFTPIDGGNPIIYDHDEPLTLSTRTPTPFLIPAFSRKRRLMTLRRWPSAATCVTPTTVTVRLALYDTNDDRHHGGEGAV